ncbi:MAG: 50S ribosomal protein L22 [Candidatus Paceibacteria bacterium]
MKATLKNYRQSPRKVRLVADLIKGKQLSEALTLLEFTMKRAAGPMQKLVRSAAANAEQKGARAGDLVVKSVTVDEGTVLHRMMPRAFGRATPLKKRSSHVTVTLGKKGEK